MPSLITLSCSLPACFGFSSSLIAYSRGCVSRLWPASWSMTVMICCFTRPFLPLYSSGRSDRTNAVLVILLSFSWCWLLFARTLPAKCERVSLLSCPAALRNGDGKSGEVSWACLLVIACRQAHNGENRGPK